MVIGDDDFGISRGANFWQPVLIADPTVDGYEQCRLMFDGGIQAAFTDAIAVLQTAWNVHVVWAVEEVKKAGRTATTYIRRRQSRRESLLFDVR